jgi:hypothetical protein
LCNLACLMIRYRPSWDIPIKASDSCAARSSPLPEWRSSKTSA